MCECDACVGVRGRARACARVFARACVYGVVSSEPIRGLDTRACTRIRTRTHHRYHHHHHHDHHHHHHHHHDHHYSKVLCIWEILLLRLLEQARPREHSHACVRALTHTHDFLNKLNPENTHTHTHARACARACTRCSREKAHAQTFSLQLFVRWPPGNHTLWSQIRRRSFNIEHGNKGTKNRKQKARN